MEDEDVMRGTIQGEFIVRDGESVRAVRGATVQGGGDVEGHFRIDSGATVLGGIRVAEGGVLEVAGAHVGPLSVDEGGSVVVEQFGKLRGPLANWGDVQVHGSFGGPVSGNEPRLHPGSRVIEPEIRDGKTIYNG